MAFQYGRGEGRNMAMKMKWIAAAYALTVGAPSLAQTTPPASMSAEEIATSKARIESALQSLMRLEIRSTPNARSNATLGEKREGNGVLIEKDLVLTIGYLVMEADEIEVTDVNGKKLPATVAGYDHSTGFGLVRLITPTSAKPVSLGNSDRLTLKEALLSVPFGGIDAAQPSFLVSKKVFTGSWEYKLDQALYTFPPLGNWSGAGLFSKEGALVGIGSLFLRDVDGEGVPGNMFVPIDLIKPILGDLKNDGRSKAPARPWLGVSTEERSRGLIVSRVSPEGPADEAGLKTGDVITGVNGDAVRTQADFYDAIWKRGAAGITVNLTVTRAGEEQRVKVKSIDRMDFLKPRTTL
jgi:serine protease Do